MSLKAKITLLMTFWLIFILTLFNVFIYFFFIHLTTQSEVQLMWKKAATILSKVDMYNPNRWDDPELLNEFLVTNELIRIIGPDDQIKLQVYSNERLLQKKVYFRKSNHSEVLKDGENRMIFLQVPLQVSGKQIGMLEIGHLMNILDHYVEILLTALMITTGGAVLLSLAGGFFYTRFLFRPIKHLANTMEAIQISGLFRKLDLEQLSLSDELGQLGITFNRMIGRLEKNFTRQQQFIEDASHELRTPLTVIESYSELLKRWGMNDPLLSKEAIEAIHSEAIRLKQLVSSLLQLVDFDVEESANREMVDLVPLVQSTVNSMQHSFHRKIELKTEEEQLVIEGDAQKFKQLLIILLDNAIKYSRKKIRVSLTDLGEHIRISVIDQGIGINPEVIPRIFDRFYREDQARSRKTDGFGLGLAIAGKIVEIHGGSIRIRSKKAMGTNIVITFPKRFTKQKLRESSH